MAITNEVVIQLRDGTVLDTWSQYAVTIDLLYPGSAWTLSVYGSDVRNTTWDLLREKALLGEHVYLYIDGAIQLSGQIEVRREDAGRQGAQMTLSGRDLAGPALDWDANPAIHLKDTTLEEALVALFEPLDVSLFMTDGASQAQAQRIRSPMRQREQTGHGHPQPHTHFKLPASLQKKQRHNPVDLFKVRPGDRIWQVADTLCKRAGYFIWTAPYVFTDEEGTHKWIGLVVDTPMEEGSPEMVLYRTQGDRLDGSYTGNVLHSTYEAQIRNIPTSVTSFGHSKLAGGKDSRSFIVTTNDALLDHPLVIKDMTAHPLYLSPDRVRNGGGAEKAAKSEISKFMANFLYYEATVQGHSQRIDGQDKIWAINTIVTVKDEIHKIEQPMLVTRVHFEGARDRGQRTNIKCVPLGVIKPEPEDMPPTPRHDPRALRRDAATMNHLTDQRSGRRNTHH